MIEVAKKIAEVKQIDINEVAKATSNNARQLFNL
jgi:Tat protein secretion system quality control protein TatD with DNase activity